MSSPIKVNTENVQAVEARISTTLRKLQSRLDLLESELNPIQNHWTGDARAAYQGDKQKWDQAAADMNTVLNQLQKAVGDAHATYVQVNNKTRSLFG